MGRNRLESIPDAKSQLVLEICSMASTPIACSHRHQFNKRVKSHFIDWYRLLGVAEDAGLELVKKRYFELALQLHPDKNKHPKAEVAFKLVSEAYACLSDNVRRRAFNSERWKYFCIQCSRIPYPNAIYLAHSQHSSKLKALDPTSCSRSGRVMQGLKDIRNRFKEEIRVIEHCLRVNSLSRRESRLFNPSNNLCQSKIEQNSQRETPVFEPSDYLFHGYPHVRSRISMKPESSWQLHRRSVQGRISMKPESSWQLHRRSIQGRGTDDSPIFTNASETGIFGAILKSKSVFIHS